MAIQADLKNALKSGDKARVSTLRLLLSAIKNEQINKANALWTIGKSEIKDEEYKDFYTSISHDSGEPLTWMHNKAEGAIEYTTLFYIPEKAPMDLYRVDYQTGIKLYINRVFITDDEKELMPTYLRFLRGVIDSADLPLNVSREILQSNPEARIDPPQCWT